MLKLEFELNQKHSGLTLILLTCHLRIHKKPMFWRYSAPVGQSLLSYIKMHTVRKQRSGGAPCVALPPRETTDRRTIHDRQLSADLGAYLRLHRRRLRL